MNRIRRAHKTDAAAIGRVHVETWQATYAGLLPDSMLAGMSDVRQSAYWSRVLADRHESRGVFVADDEDMGVVGFGSCGPVREPPEGLSGREIPVGEVYTLYVEPDFQKPRPRPAPARRPVPPVARRRLRHRRAVDAGRQSSRFFFYAERAASGWASASTPWPGVDVEEWPRLA